MPEPAGRCSAAQLRSAEACVAYHRLCRAARDRVPHATTKPCHWRTAPAGGVYCSLMLMAIGCSVGAVDRTLSGRAAHQQLAAPALMLMSAAGCRATLPCWTTQSSLCSRGKLHALHRCFVDACRSCHDASHARVAQALSSLPHQLRLKLRWLCNSSVAAGGAPPAWR